jgi:hypothetical protein
MSKKISEHFTIEKTQMVHKHENFSVSLIIREMKQNNNKISFPMRHLLVTCQVLLIMGIHGNGNGKK